MDSNSNNNFSAERGMAGTEGLMMLPKKRVPTHPGEVLLEEFLEPLGLTQFALAAHLGVPVQRSTSSSEASAGSACKRPGYWPEPREHA